MKVDLSELLRFFDEVPEGSQGDATAVAQILGEDLGIALTLRALAERFGDSCIVARKCTTGKRKGPRLDAWLRATIDGHPTLLQTEIKMWSAHAIGGQKLPINAPALDVIQFSKERWRLRWNGQRFRLDALQKVLRPMRPPTEEKVEPLACMWEPILATHIDKIEPLFSVPVHTERFNRVWVFSMSNYIRVLERKIVTLDLPRAQRRLEWLSSFVSPHGEESLDKRDA